MIAVVVLTVGIGAALEHWASVQDVRTEVIARDEVEELATEVANRFLGALGEELGVGWSAPIGFNPLTRDGRDEAFLIANEILRGPAGLENLLVNIDYFRAINHVSPAGTNLPGLLGLGSTDPASTASADAEAQQKSADFNAAIAGSSAYALNDGAGLFLKPDAAPGTTLPAATTIANLDEEGHIGQFDPVIIRLVIRWGERNGNGIPRNTHTRFVSRRAFRDL
jgi:hypothetical protein